MRRRASRKERFRSRSENKPPARRGGLWRWLGLGAIGLAVATLLRGERRVAGRRPQLAEDPLPPPRPVLEPPADVEISWVPGPSGSLRVLERHRDGKLPVVFLHGLGGRAEQWSAQLDAAGPGLRTVALDLPGHGGSDPSAVGDDSIAALAAAIGAVADALELRSMVLVAHSLGASAAIEYAASHPRRVDGMLLVDPSGDQSRLPDDQKRQLSDQLRRDPSGELAWHFRQLLLGAHPEVAERVLEQLADVPEAVCTGIFESALEHSPVPALGRLDVPVKTVVSDLNTLPYSLHNIVPDLPTSHIGGTSHWLMMDRPDAFWEVLVDFLDRVRSPRAQGPTPP